MCVVAFFAARAQPSCWWWAILFFFAYRLVEDWSAHGISPGRRHPTPYTHHTRRSCRRLIWHETGSEGMAGLLCPCRYPSFSNMTWAGCICYPPRYPLVSAVSACLFFHCCWASLPLACTHGLNTQTFCCISLSLLSTPRKLTFSLLCAFPTLLLPSASTVTHMRSFDRHEHG